MRTLLLVFILASAVVGAAGARTAQVPRLIFPVVGQAAYEDDFGDPRGQGRHQGIDIVAARRAPAVAVEAGTVQFWTTSSRAGCMLYLKGRSGTVYQYIHLNNDLGKGNDNRGTCVPGVAYTPGLEDGAAVSAGQPIGLVGNSGDADGIHPHLHFEVHPGGKAAVNPYRYLRRAQRLLFVAAPGSTVTLSLTGTVLASDDSTLTLRASTLRVVPDGLSLTKVGRKVTLALLPGALVTTRGGGGLVGRSAVALTEPAVATLAVQLGKGLSAARVAPATGP
jgi:hypothetical protein